MGGNFADSDLGTIAFGTVSGGAAAKLTGGNFWQGAVTGLFVSALNHVATKMIKPKYTVAGIYGAGSEEGSGNPDLRALVEGQGGKMFSSTTPFGEGDDEIIAYLKEGFEKGNQLKLYGHSRGGAAAVRIANILGEMNIHVSEINLYDPVGLYGGGDFVFNYPNVTKVNNYYQRNPTDHGSSARVGKLASNPFQGSPVGGNFQWPVINNVNLTGHYYSSGVLMSHLNITDYAIRHP